MAAEQGDTKFISKLDEEGKKKAKVELNELNDVDRQIAVQTLRQWVIDQDWFRSPIDFAFLLRFLRVRKFSQLGARETLENYWKGKTNIPKWFLNVDPADETIQEIFKTGWLYSPMKYDKKGRRVVLCKFSSVTVGLVKKCGVDSLYKALFLLYDWLLLDESVQVYGLLVVVDYSGMTLQLMMAIWNAEISKKCIVFYQKALPMRMKGIHLYNEPTFIDVFMSLINPFLRQKIKDRIILHGKSLVKIYEEVGMDVLPDEYLPDDYKGCSAGPVENIISDMLEDMVKPEFRKYMMDISSDKYGVDLKKSKNDDTPAASFRKLNVS